MARQTGICRRVSGISFLVTEVENFNQNHLYAPSVNASAKVSHTFEISKE